MSPIFKATRRGFIKTTAALGVGYWVAGRAGAEEGAPEAKPAEPPSEKVRFACIGIGGKGDGDTHDAGRLGQVVAICDIDDDRLTKAAERYPDAKKFYDFRDLFEEMSGRIDAVTVSTADHTHAVATVRAMKEGKAVFCQKPLTHSLWEARRVAEVARETKVATQMGNQGTASKVLRNSAAMVRAGMLGPVHEIHLWSNRPIWPQGGPRPESKPVPKNVHWNAWLGPAPKRDYGEGYHPFAWRAFWDFGTGALGDMGCHTMNMPFMALDLRDPVTAMAETSGHNKEMYPKWSIIQYEFAANDKRPAVKMTWYDGGKRPPAELLEGAEFNESGALLIGEKGKLYSPGSDGNTMTLLGGAQAMEVPVRESPGHFDEFVAAIKGGEPALSNFADYAGALTETVLLGNLAVWTADSGSGPKIEWDAKNLAAKNVSNLEKLIKPDYRPGYSIG
ncbi:MAG TPA: Gfo/Idh/MocA family oxidoreductase [Pirellulales bacterium]|jgi:predicted dehydrogenase|nr:Gfo/Idh/MocA family oxidoreductase [Pirellulales bacterium]